MEKILEWRGVKDLVCAQLLEDSEENLLYGPVFSLAGVAELSRATENSSETHYYDNIPAIIINSVGGDTVSITASAIGLKERAKITGQDYDDDLGALSESSDTTPPYFALGYKTQKTNGDEVYVWRFKGKFSLPDDQHSTKKNDASANGNTLTFTGVETEHKFTKRGGKTSKAIVVDVAEGKADVSTFFDQVTTWDTITAAANKVATPTAYPPAEEPFTSGNTVYLECATAGADIYYTTDGSTPTSASTAYTNGIILTATTTIKAIAVKSGLSDSDVATFTYPVS